MNGHHIETHTPVPAVLVDEEGNMINGGKTVTLMKANHHAGIGPVDDGIPYALRTTVDDSKNWYKSMFNKVHKLSRGSEDENSNFVDTGIRNPYRSPQHSSTATERPVRIGSIFDYQPGDEYVVENKPIKKNLNQPQPQKQAPTSPARTHQVNVENMQRNHNLSVGSVGSSSYRNDKTQQAPATATTTKKSSTSNATRFSFETAQQKQQRARPSSYHTAVNQLHSATPTYNRRSMNLSTNNNELKPPKYLLQHHEHGGGSTGRGGSTAQSSSSSSYSDVFVRKSEAARPSWIENHHHNNSRQQAKSTTTTTATGGGAASSAISDEGATEESLFADTNEMATKMQTPGSKIDARVKFDFGGQTARELSVKKGQLIKILHKKDANWYMAEDAGGKNGIVPIKYVEVIVPEVIQEKASLSGLATAKFDFAGNSKRELPFKKGDQLELIKKIDSNWYRAKLGESSGIVPITYITVTAEPKQETPKKVHVPEAPVAAPATTRPLVSKSADTTSSRVTSSSSNRGYSPVAVSNHVINNNIAIAKEDEPAENERKNRAAILANTVVTNSTQLKSIENNKAPIQYEFDLSELEDVVQSFDDLSTPRSNTSSSAAGGGQDSEFGEVIGRFVAQFPYQACNEDELDLQAGDITHVVEICDDGWYVGTCERTRAFGTFPGNFVKAI